MTSKLQIKRQSLPTYLPSSSTTKQKQQKNPSDYYDTDLSQVDTYPQNEQQIPKNTNNKYPSFFFSQILDQQQQQNQTQVHPQYLRIKNNLLLFLFIFSAYGIYYLIGDFIDFLILGYIAGLAYHQTRGRFIKFIMDSRTYNGHSKSLLQRIIKSILLILFILILPRLRQMLSNPLQIYNVFQFKQYIIQYQNNHNLVVILCQIFAAMYCFYLLIGTYLKKIGQKLRPKNPVYIKYIFGFIVFIFVLSTIALIPTVFFKQVGQMGILAQQKIQQKLQCRIISLHKQNTNTTLLPLCSQKLTTQNTMIKSIIQQFRSQNQTVKLCKIYINKLQLDYLGSYIFHYDDIVCTWYSIFNKASNYTAINHHIYTQDISTATIFSTGTNIFKHIFGNLTSIIIGFSNIIFCFTIFMTTFVLTAQVSSRYLAIKTLFSENKQKLVSSITSLIQATSMIVIWHFVASIILLELFDFTPINLIVAILLSFMAFIPFFRPWFGILFVSLFRMAFLHQYYISVVFIALYYQISQYIYSFYYNKMDIHQIITNMSVLFGIYRFGISGIFYGPLIIILYSCFEKELLIKYHIKKKNSGNKNQGNLQNIDMKKKKMRHFDTKKPIKIKKQISIEQQNDEMELQEEPKYEINIKNVKKPSESQSKQSKLSKKQKKSEKLHKK